MKNSGLSRWRRAGLLAAAPALLLTACAPNQDTPTPTTGVDLSHYLAVGGSYTAGYSADGLTRTGQEYSFPALLAKQFRDAAGGSDFVQPLLEPGTGSGYLALVDLPASGIPVSRRVVGTSVRGTVINPAACNGPDTLRLLNRSATASAGLPQNLGVPGLALTQIETVGLGNQANARPGVPFNPYFERLLPANDNRTYLQAVTTAAASATFFTFFQGLDDLMPYIRSGGTCGTPPSNALGDQMKANAKKILTVLTAGHRPGIAVRLPSLTSLPLLNQGQGTLVQAQMQALYKDNLLLYIESPGGGGSQPITDKDYVLATALPRIGKMTPVQVGGTTLTLPYGRDSRNPLRDADVLEAATEMNPLNGVVNNYNSFTSTSATILASRGAGLDGLAQSLGLPVVDFISNRSTLNIEDALFNQVAGTINVGGVQYSPAAVRGNFYSLDYVTLTPRGSGLLANVFISAINRAYHANIPAIDVNKLPTTAQ